MTCEEHARENIDQLLTQAGWIVQNVKDTNIYAGKGVAIREFPLKQGHGYADYLLYVDGKAAGVIEAKKSGTTLTGVEIQSDKYATGMPDSLPVWSSPLPFCYQSTGDETRFTNNLDPEPRSRQVFAFHKPDYIFEEADKAINQTAEASAEYLNQYSTLRGRLRTMPDLIEEGLWPAQIQAVRNLEQSLAKDCPRSLIQMATGSGKTFTAISIIYRLIKFAGARRVLFLVDRGNLGKQTLKEFQQYVSPYNNYKFSEEFIVQRLTSNTIDTTARVCISTIQRLYSMLRGHDLPEEAEDQSPQGLDSLFKEVLPLEYNPDIPISTFDFIITDECHRSIYNLWRQVLEYFDAHLIGLTATPSKQTFGFFNRNLVMEYDHERAVADGVNVNYDVYRIKTAITEQGSKVESGYYIDKRDRDTRTTRWEKLEEDFEYDPNKLDRDVVAVDQIRTIIQTFRDKVLTEIFPGREYVPKTLIFAKDDSHAEDIVKIVREEFGKGNDFAQKITYKTTGVKPEDLIASFRNSFNPRIAVTVDMIATGTDIKPLEIVMFMRAVRSRSFFEQMKGRGVRIINKNDLQSVTPDARVKDHFIIVDCVGVCEMDKTDSRPMERKPTVSLEKLLQAIALGNTDPDVASSLAARMARIGRQITPEDDRKVMELAGGRTLEQVTTDLVNAIKPDTQIDRVYLRRAEQGRQADTSEPTEAELTEAATKLIIEAAQPLHNPELRNFLVEVKEKNEQVIDNISEDQVLEVGFSAEALEKVKSMVQSFEQFLADNRDEITALQILYSKPYKSRLRFEDIKELAARIEKPPHHFRVDNLWDAYAALEKAKVKGANAPHILTDLVSLVRFAMHQENELVPYPEKVESNFNAWFSQQDASGKKFTDEQRQWLVMIRDHIAANLGIETEDFDYAPFSQQGGLGKVYQLFGDELNVIIEELNEALAA